MVVSIICLRIKVEELNSLSDEKELQAYIVQFLIEMENKKKKKRKFT